MSEIKKIALVYKSSVYEKLCLRPNSLFRKIRMHGRTLVRLKQAHHNHFDSLSRIEATLKKTRIRFDKFRRGDVYNFRRYDLVITVGGDGTFLETARNLEDELILGVNSDPLWSTGRFCEVNAAKFPKFLDEVLKGRYSVRPVQRLRLELNRKILPFNVLNDFLICHQNPAAMSHYYLLICKSEEEQRSSGLWVSTAAGSTAAIFSAGGKKLPITSKKIQYLPRELYRDGRCHYRLKGGTVGPGDKLEIVSCMTEGMVFVDGTYLRIPFYFGSRLVVTPSPHPLKMVTCS